MFERFKIDNHHHHHLQVQCIACNGSSCQISTSHRRRLVHVRTARKLYYWGHNLERNRTTHWNASDENHSAGVHKAAVGSTAIVDLPTHTHTHARTDTHTHTLTNVCSSRQTDTATEANVEGRAISTCQFHLRGQALVTSAYSRAVGDFCGRFSSSSSFLTVILHTAS